MTEQGDAEPAESGRVKLLLVDDEEAVRTVSGHVLQAAGYDVLSANNGEEALARYREHPDITIVVLDLSLPGMSGEQLFDELKQLNSELRILVNTGSDPSDLSRIVDDPHTRILLKPYRPQMMLDTISKWLTQMG